MKEPMIADLARYENQAITGFFCAAQKSVRAKKDGSHYLALSFADRSGQIEARMWEMDAAGEFAQGDVVKVRGQVSRYQEKLQINVELLRKAREDEYEFADFVPATSRDIDELWAELEAFVANFQDRDLQRLVRAFLEDPEIAAALRMAPAAKSMHHAWIGGLLEHIVSLVGICDLTGRYYPDVNCDLLLTGAMLHDIGKLQELRWGTSFEYTLPGQLLGHITIGVGMVEKKIAQLVDFPEAKRVLVQHMILSHHGKYEFGSPKLPMIPEAILLHYLDDMDAKMQTVRNEFARAEANGRPAWEVTDWVRSMERPLLNTQAYLATGQGASTEAETETKEAIPNALPFED
jgi:3'-5' exoribonuclease